MNRWRKLLVCVGIAMAGCPGPGGPGGTFSAKTGKEAGKEASDCPPVASSFCQVEAPPAVPDWQGEDPPVAGPKQIFETFWDPQGNYVAALVDTNFNGKITWVARVPPAKIGDLVSKLAGRGPIDGTRPVPPPPPPIVDWRKVAERAYRALQIDPMAEKTVMQCGGTPVQNVNPLTK
jgi:hypothetical protein